MRKPLRINQSGSRKTIAGAAAVSLTLALAAFGCTSAKMAEERRPVAPTVTPAATNPIPIAAQNGNVPMISSGPASQLDPAVDAQAALAARQNRGGRVLGTSDPGPNPLAGAVLPATGQFIQPAAAATPLAAVPMTPAIPVFAAGPYDTGTAVMVSGVNVASVAVPPATATMTAIPAADIVRMVVPAATGASSTLGTTVTPTAGAVSSLTSQANARIRAAGASTSATPQANAGGRAVRITSSSDGTPLVTNVTAQQRVSLAQRIRRFFTGSSATGQTTPKP